MITLQQGSHGPKVEFLQALLNKAALRERAGGTPLRTDGNFGPRTNASLKAFQTRHPPLQVNGMADNSVFSALGLRTSVEHTRVILFGQPSTTSCWSAAATMILGNQSVGQGNATLTPVGSIYTNPENVSVFARGLGWSVLNHSPSVSELVSIVARTPVWLTGGGADWGHAVVLSAVYSDGDNAGDGTLFRIHDPWPMNSGRIYGSFANPLRMLNASGNVWLPASLTSLMIP